jgi:hypothetical protein
VRSDAIFAHKFLQSVLALKDLLLVLAGQDESFAAVLALPAVLFVEILDIFFLDDLDGFVSEPQRGDALGVDALLVLLLFVFGLQFCEFRLASLAARSADVLEKPHAALDPKLKIVGDTALFAIGISASDDLLQFEDGKLRLLREGYLEERVGPLLGIVELSLHQLPQQIAPLLVLPHLLQRLHVRQEDVPSCGLRLDSAQVDPEEGNDGGRHSGHSGVSVEEEGAGAGIEEGLEREDRGHAGLHGVVGLGLLADAHEVAALVAEQERLPVGALPQKVLNFILELFGEERAQGVVLQLEFLVAERGGAAGVYIDNGPEGAVFYADQHDVARGVGPVLQGHPLLQLVLLLDGAVDLVEHVLVVLYALQVVGVAGGHPLGMRYPANSPVVFPDLLSDPDARERHLVELLEIGVVVVEQRPEFEVDERRTFESLHEQLLLALDQRLADQVQKLVAGLVQLPVDLLLQHLQPVEFVQGESVGLHEHQAAKCQLSFAALVEESSILELQFGTDGSQSIPVRVDVLYDVLASQQLLVTTGNRPRFQQFAIWLWQLRAGGAVGIVALLPMDFHVAVEVYEVGVVVS